MVNIIKAEMLKLKGSYMLWISLVVAALIPIINTVVFLSNKKYQFGILAENTLGLGIMLVYPCLYGMIITYLFNREYQEDMMKTLLTIPISKNNLVIGKIILLFLWSVLINGWSSIVTIVSATVLNMPGINFNNIIYAFFNNIKTAPLYVLCMLPIVAIVIASKKSYTVSLGICVVMTLGNIILTGTGDTKLASIYPWLVMIRLNGSGIQIPFEYPLGVSILSLGIFVIISLLIAFRSIQKQDN